MDNFLDHLVARSWNQVETVQPRPLSLFEPTPKIGKTAVPPAISWNTMDKTSSSDTPKEEEMDSSQPLAPRPALKQEQLVQQLLDPEPVIATIVHERTAVPTPDQQFAIPPQMTRPHPQHVSTACGINPASIEKLSTLPHPTAPLPQAPVKQSPQTEPAVQERIIERSVVAHKPDTVPIKAEPLAQSFSARPQIVPEPDPSVTAVLPVPVDQSIATLNHKPPSVKKLTTNIQPQIRPFVPPQTRLSSEPQQAEATPTINVTIGRIEVRGTPAPTTPTRKKHPQSPVMDLDEYLRQRNGEQK